MQVYAAEAIYDDPLSYCDTRYKIAGQWYGELIADCCLWQWKGPGLDYSSVIRPCEQACTSTR